MSTTPTNDGGPVRIPLKNGGFAIISKCDEERITKNAWRSNARGYVFLVGGRTKGKPILMHRIIMDAIKGEEIHHRNGDPFDNRRENLERTTASEHQKLYHSHRVIARNQAGRIYPTERQCKHCGITFSPNRDHRGHQVCCGKKCSSRLAIAARKPRVKLAARNQTTK